jgi:hypothetical protein
MDRMPTYTTQKLAVYSVAVYDDGSTGDGHEQSFTLLDGDHVALERQVGRYVIGRAASLIDAPKARLKDEGRRCCAVHVTLSIYRGER